VSGPPLIDLVSDSYRTLYLHLAATGANIPIVTVAGDDSGIVATVASNIAAAAAYEARSVLLVDADPTTSTISRIFRISSNPGLTGIISGQSDWASSIVQTTIGRDRTLDVLPSGGKRGAPDPQVAERIRADFARMERRYDVIVIAAPTAYVQRGPTSIIPGPDVVLCVRAVHTRIARLREAVASLRFLDLRIHGLVLWNDDMPVIEAHDEFSTAKNSPSDSRYGYAGAR
jgi:tyrosine-protein kinase Etk/Wzc